MMLTTDTVASAPRAAFRYVAVRWCCNWTARSNDAFACLRAMAFDRPDNSTARYLSSIRLASVLLTFTSSRGGCRSASKTVCANEISVSRHNRPTVWNCSSWVAVFKRVVAWLIVRSMRDQPVGSVNTSALRDDGPSRNLRMNGSIKPLTYCRRDS